MAADRASTWRFFLLPLVLTVVGYIAFWSCDAHLRQRRGPWQVEFDRVPAGFPVLRIHQPALGITNVSILFGGETTAATNLPATVVFDVPRRAPPFGTNVFEDLTYQPGNVTLHCFGHEVQFLPRTLVINRRERPWENHAAITLTPSDRLPTLVLSEKPRRPAQSPAIPPR
ncbi:MAG: hypothetical protein ACKVYV_17515 [Limisphaerales bacterium]